MLFSAPLKSVATLCVFCILRGVSSRHHCLRVSLSNVTQGSGCSRGGPSMIKGVTYRRVFLLVREFGSSRRSVMGDPKFFFKKNPVPCPARFPIWIAALPEGPPPRFFRISCKARLLSFVLLWSTWTSSCLIRSPRFCPQVLAPRRADPEDPKHSVYDPTAVMARSTLFAAPFRRQQRRKTIPHFINDIMSTHKYT